MHEAYYSGDKLATIKEGSKAPDFALPDANGKLHKLSEYKGKYLILYFYPRDNTPGCTIEAKEFNDALGTLKKAGAEVVGVSKDDQKSHTKFIDSCDLGFTLLSDPDSKTIKAYGSYGDRGIFGMGTLRKTYIIDKSGKIVKIFEKVKPFGHAKQVLAAIKEIE